MAPASRINPPVTSSRITAAVNPAPDAFLPETNLPFGARFETYRNNWDFPTAGSPIKKRWIFPRILVPSGWVFGTPPNNWRRIASFISGYP